MARIVIAGSTGVVGQNVVRIANERGLDIVPLVRPKSASVADPRAVVVSLDDVPALEKAMAGATTVMQLIGTMRKRFSSGDTYETSDIGTTRSLVRAAKAASLQHFVLLSALGAGTKRGAYLKAKARAEQLVTDSGLSFTIFRPSAFTGVEGRQVPAFVGSLTKWLGLAKLQPIHVRDLARALLLVARDGEPKNAILEGESLWRVVESGRAAFGDQSDSSSS